jgi:hypothetical protein
MVHPCRVEGDTAGNPGYTMHAVIDGARRTICGAMVDLDTVGERHGFGYVCRDCFPLERRNPTRAGAQISSSEAAG